MVLDQEGFSPRDIPQYLGTFWEPDWEVRLVSAGSKDTRETAKHPRCTGQQPHGNKLSGPKCQQH